MCHIVLTRVRVTQRSQKEEERIVASVSTQLVVARLLRSRDTASITRAFDHDWDDPRSAGPKLQKKRQWIDGVSLAFGLLLRSLCLKPAIGAVLVLMVRNVPTPPLPSYFTEGVGRMETV